MSHEQEVRVKEQASFSHPSFWRTSVRQTLWSTVGIVLFGLLTILFNVLQIPNAAEGALAFLPASGIPLIFGVFFGPLVGFLVGGGGTLLSDVISYHAFFWNWELGNALIGFIAGLARFLITRRNKDTRSIVLAHCASLLAIVIGVGFAAGTDRWVAHIDGDAAIGEFLFGSLSLAINGLILLFLVLLASNGMGKGRNVWLVRRGKRVGGVALLVGLSLAIITASLLSLARPHLSPPASTRVIINASQPLGTLSTISIGLNTALFDPNLRISSTETAITNAGVGILRFPGGLDADLYHWQSHTLLNGQIDPGDTFDAFMQSVQSADAQAMITVNYGAGTPAEAAGWVQYANKGGIDYHGPVPDYSGGSRTGHTYGITYWEIGNEVYGDGTYVTSWEYNAHARGPLTYASNVVAYSRAMKAIDPTIKIGAVLTAPGIWPDGVISPLSRRPWNQTVLSTACTSLDFVVVHWYAQAPGSESDAGLLSSTGQIASMISTLRDEIRQFCGSHAEQVQIMLTETNSVSYHPGKQTVSQVNALFLADNYMTWLEDGVANVDWWNLHDGWAPTGFNNSASLAGTAQFGDYGMLSSHLCSGAICEPAVNTPFPPYFALQMLKYLGRPGDTMVTASSNQALIAVHAVKQANGNLAILLINKSPGTSSLVSFLLKGYTAKLHTTVYTFSENSSSITSTTGSSTRITIAPYSLATVVLSPG